MAPAASILSLDDQQLRQICAQFCPHCGGGACQDPLSDFEDAFKVSRLTLCALARVDKQIGRQAQLVLFHVFAVRAKQLPLLLRTLVEKPALAPHVYVVRLGGDGVDQLCVLQHVPADAAKRLRASIMPELRGDQHLTAPFSELPEPDGLESLDEFRISALTLEQRELRRWVSHRPKLNTLACQNLIARGWRANLS
ncbi:hypothetical protein VTK56DRAFT_4155 [Thermocarpiscus australiensis]